MQSYFFVGLGGALGSVLRFWLAGLIAGNVGATFPYGTLFVNATGSLVVGALAAFGHPDGRWLLTPSAREFLIIGLCGGYTTFSAFSLQTLLLAQEGDWWRAGINCLLSFTLCLVAVWLGYACCQHLQRS